MLAMDIRSLYVFLLFLPIISNAKVDDETLDQALEKFAYEKLQELNFARKKGADQTSLHKTSQGVHASFNRPNPDALKMAEVAYVLEHLTSNLNRLEEEKKQSSFLGFRWKRDWRQYFTSFFSRTNSTFEPQSPRLVRHSDITVIRILPKIRTTLVRNQIPSVLTAVDEMSEKSDTEETTLGNSCDLEVHEENCQANEHYRTFSGLCNNLANPKFGKNTIPFRRLLPSEYSDGVSRSKTDSVSVGPLPNVRTISRVVHAQKTGKSVDKDHSLMLMQWGQFLDHDLTLTPMIRGENNAILDCQRCDSNRFHKGCYPILVPTGDDYFPIREGRSTRRKCIPFTRSLPGQQIIGPREQLNQNTAFVDASNLYGSDPCRNVVIF